jgi:DNA polymerase-3 subunit delta'
MKLAASEDFSSMVAQIMDLLKSADKLSFEDLLAGVEQLESYKLNIKDYLSFIRMWYRDILIYKATGDPNILIFDEETHSIRKFASRCSYNGINQILEAVDVTERRLDANVNFAQAMELLWLTIRDASKA